MKHTLSKIGTGLLAWLVAAVMVSPTLAATSGVKISAVVNPSLSRFVLVHGELSAISSTTLPAELTISVKKPLPKGSMGSTLHVDQLITVAVDEHTIFSHLHFGKGSLSELAIGDSLQVFGRFNDQGVLQALSVKDDSLQTITKSITGRISEINNDDRTFMLVHLPGFSAKWLPLTVRVTDDTTIVDMDGTAMSWEDLMVDEQVSVKGVLNTQAHTLIATHIKVKVQAPEPLPFSLQGTLLSMSSTTLPATITVKVTDIQPPIQTNARALLIEPIDEVTLQVNAQTKFFNHSGGVITLADLTLGDTLAIQASQKADDTLVATIVRDESLEVITTALEGKISSLNGTEHSLVVTKADATEVTVMVSNATVLHVPGVADPTFTDLKVGDMVQVQGLLNTQTNIVMASDVMVTAAPPEPIPFSFEGTLTAISSTTLPATLTITVTDVHPPLENGLRPLVAEPVNSLTFQVDANTNIRSDSGRVLTLADLTIGDTLVVQGNTNSDDTITATIIVDHSVDLVPKTLSGNITALDPLAMSLVFASSTGASYTAQLSTTTTIVVPGVISPTFADLGVGNGIEVIGIVNVTGDMIAASQVTVTATTTSGTPAI